MEKVIKMEKQRTAVDWLFQMLNVVKVRWSIAKVIVTLTLKMMIM